MTEANDFTTNTILLVMEGEGCKGSREKSGSRGSGQVQPLGARKKLDITQLKWGCV